MARKSSTLPFTTERTSTRLIEIHTAPRDANEGYDKDDRDHFTTS